MKKLIVVSEMRTGSTWLADMLAAAMNCRWAHVEHAGRGLNEQRAAAMRNGLDSRKLMKQHALLPEDFFRFVRPVDYAVVSIVRNPRDLLLSLTFYKWPRLQVLPAEELRNRLRQVLREDQTLFTRQAQRMVPAASTRRGGQAHYVWTAYEWLKDDPAGELLAVLEAVGVVSDPERVERIALSGARMSPAGDAQAYRRGIVGDWVNYFDGELVESTAEIQHDYWRRLMRSA